MVGWGRVGYTHELYGIYHAYMHTLYCLIYQREVVVGWTGVAEEGGGLTVDSMKWSE